MKKTRRIVSVVIALICLIIIVLTLIYQRIIILNHPSKADYPVRGVDVSNYQGQIDWKVLSAQDIDFAFIKATEGSSHVDKRFKSNWKEARKTGLRVGAYHFFSYDSLGETQADHFISVVQNEKELLPPVVDIEFYGDKEKNLPDVMTTREQLQIMLNKLETYYGVKPIIYATLKSYHLYIKDAFDEYPLWIRNVYYSPNLDMKGKWQFWQYSDHTILEGYSGDEKYIDMNVFHGSEEEFEKFILGF